MNSTQRTLEFTVDYNWVSINLDSHISVLDEDEHTKVLRVSFYSRIKSCSPFKRGLERSLPYSCWEGRGGGVTLLN